MTTTIATTITRPFLLDFCLPKEKKNVQSYSRCFEEYLAPRRSASPRIHTDMHKLNGRRSLPENIVRKKKYTYACESKHLTRRKLPRRLEMSTPAKADA